MFRFRRGHFCRILASQMADPITSIAPADMNGLRFLLESAA